jgi:hypothetical protein
MVGNSAQDLGALGGFAGSAGVAIGQMAEYASDAALAGEGLASALGSMALVAGPIAGISLALLGINDIMTSMAEGKAASKIFDAEQVDQFTAAINKGGDAATAYNEILTDTGEVLAETGLKGGPAWTQILPPLAPLERGLQMMGQFGTEVENILPLLNRAGISSDIWTKIVTSDKPRESMDKLRAALDKTNLADEDRHDILVAARAAQDNYNDAVANSIEVNKFFTESTSEQTTAIEALNTQQERYLALLEQRAGEAAEQKAVADATDRHYDALARLNVEAERVDRARLLAQEAEATVTVTEAYQGLFDTVDAELRRLQLAKAFEDAREQIASGNLSIAEQRILLERLKLDVLRYADEVLNLPPEVATSIVAKVDEGSLGVAEADLNDWARTHNVPVLLEPDLSAFVNIPTPFGGGIKVPIPQAMGTGLPAAGTVNIINPAGTPAVTVGAVSIYDSRNGVRTDL